MPVDRVRIDDARTYLRLAPLSTEFRHGFDFVFAAGADEFRDFSGELLLASRTDAVSRKQRGGISGRVLVMDQPLGPDADAAFARFAAAGITGVIVPVLDSAAFAGAVASLSDARYSLRNEAGAPPPNRTLPLIYAGPRLTAAIAAVVRLQDTTHVEVAAHGVRTPLVARNIIALLPGTDSTPTDIAAFAAHFDHLGTVRGTGCADSIYNGFSDNAAGVAMLLGLAEALAQNPPPHATLFLFFTGEERGLLGSSWFAAHPTVPLERMRVLVNLDAGAPPAPPVSWRVATNDTTLAVSAARALEARGWSVERSSARANSDHWPLERAGVPALFLIPGADWEGLDEAGEASLRMRWDHYHQLDDEWSAEFPFSGLQRYAEAALEIVRAVMRD